MAKIIVSENGCWLWSGLKNSYGYAMLWRDGKSVRAHRIAYEIFKGPVADDLVVCHTCDAPECVNPDHLFIGTRKDNNADSARKLRNSYGERNGHARITTAQAVEIYYSTLPQVELAKKYGIHQSTISDIKTGRRWKHLPVEGPPGKPIECATRSRAKRPLKTHCKRGHLLSGENLHIKLKTGWRICLECKRLYEREYHRRRRAT